MDKPDLPLRPFAVKFLKGNGFRNEARVLDAAIELVQSRGLSVDEILEVLKNCTKAKRATP